MLGSISCRFRFVSDASDYLPVMIINNIRKEKHKTIFKRIQGF